ncbi:hypothetical protein OJJOAM_004159 [Cupriavidus sp. H18C1]
MSKALEGVRILDMTHVQAGPSATQLMAWLGADVIKVELPGRGDITRSQLRDVPNADSLYFTMLNSNKRSLTLNMKTPEGKALLEDLVERCDVLVENFGPGVLDRAGFDWDRLRALNPRLIYASIKGFGPGPYADCKAYENVAQCMGGSASTTGFEEGPPTVTGAQIGDSGTGVHCVIGILAALLQREQTGKGQRVEVAMQDAVLNLCRVKLRDQQRLAAGALREYPNKEFGDYVPRAGNASGGGQPGAALRCAPGGANDYVYVIVQPQGMGTADAAVRARGPDLASAVRHARGAPQMPARMLLDHREMDAHAHQVRGHGSAQRGRRAVRPDPVDEGPDRGPLVVRARLPGRGRSSAARPLCAARLPDQPVGIAGPGRSLAAAGRAHHRDPRMARPHARADRGAARGRRGLTPPCPGGPVPPFVRKLRCNHDPMEV